MVCRVSVRRRTLGHALVVLAALSTVAGGTAALLRSNRTVDAGFTSVALGGYVHARVILPPGYDDSTTRRYPVVYFLHGLPATSTSYRGNAWLEQAVQSAGPAILVLPQGARDADTDPEYLDWGKGRNWATYVSTELAAPHRCALPDDPEPLGPRDHRPLGGRLRRHDPRAQPPRPLLGDRVVVRATSTPPTRQGRRRSRAARSRSHTA